MAKSKEVIEVEGVVKEALPNAMFQVELANGHRAFPKERIELIWDSTVVQIDNFRRLQGWGASVSRSVMPRGQDKGHEALAAAFLAAVKGGGKPPIPPDELLEVSEWSIRAQALANSGGGEA